MYEICHVLQALSVVCRMPWPLALVLDPASLQTYNNILTFLFQVFCPSRFDFVADECIAEVPGWTSSPVFQAFFVICTFFTSK